MSNHQVNLKTAFNEAKKKSRFLCQMACSNASCRIRRQDKRWWGGRNKEYFCRVCHKLAVQVEPALVLGVGWFRCPTDNNLFAGFCRGNTESKCKACKHLIRPLFIVPGDKAEGKKKSKHCCSECNGDAPCPVIEEIREKVSNQ